MTADTEPVTIGALTRADAQRCAELEAQLFVGDDPWPPAAFNRELASPHNHYVGARSGGTLVGYAGISRLGRTPPFEYEVHTIGVDPAYQGGASAVGCCANCWTLPGVVWSTWRSAPIMTPLLRCIAAWDSSGSACAGDITGSAAPTRTRCVGIRGPVMTTVLGIETSCDETGVGIARLDPDGTVTLLADEVASSVDEHVRFGGVVPEIASRAHLEALGPAMRRALAAAGLKQPDIVAATIGPGLAGALLVGVAAAKAYSAAWGCRSMR